MLINKLDILFSLFGEWNNVIYNRVFIEFSRLKIQNKIPFVQTVTKCVSTLKKVKF